MPTYRIYYKRRGPSPSWLWVEDSAPNPQQMRDVIVAWAKTMDYSVPCFEPYLLNMPAAPGQDYLTSRINHVIKVFRGALDVFIIDGLGDCFDNDEDAYMAPTESKPKCEIAQDWFAQFQGDTIQAQAARERLAEAARTATHAAVGSNPNRPPCEAVPVKPPQPCQHYQCKNGVYEPKADPPSARYAYMQARKGRR